MRVPLLVLSVATAAVLLGPAAPALAASSGPTTGVDVSWPNTGRALPAPGAFAVVGLNSGINDGSARTGNPGLQDQLTWASTAPAVDVYINTQHPDPAKASWWPAADVTKAGSAVRSPYGRCAATVPDSAACAWVYGFSVASDDLTLFSPTLAAHHVVPRRWWLDVEEANDWTGTRGHHRAVLEGITTRLQEAGKTVGLYAAPGQFAALIGTVPAGSPLYSLPSWLTLAADERAAQHLCTHAALAHGRPLLAQWKDTAADQDHDVACATFASAPTPTLTGTKRVGRVLTAHAGTWRPGGAHLAYRWTRDGALIPKAVHATYRLGKADAGHRVRAVVTATKDGWGRTARTSAAVRVAR